MTWTQNYTPVFDSLAASALVAVVPAVVLLGLLAFFHLRAHWAALAGLAAVLSGFVSVVVAAPTKLAAPARLVQSSATKMISPTETSTVRRWDFNKTGDREGWRITTASLGVVMGGSLWLTMKPEETDPVKITSYFYQIHGDKALHPQVESRLQIESPGNLEIRASGVQQVRLRVLNLSAATDLRLRWRTKDQGWGEKNELGRLARSRMVALKGNCKEWQEITCYVDGRWQGIIDQIAFQIPKCLIRGDIWIDKIEIGTGAPEPVRARPDVASSNVVPKISIPGLAQADFADAFSVLDECLIVDVPVQGFTYPVMAPGGRYGDNWWALDSSLNVTGAKWANQHFAEDTMRGFRDVQAENPDGRIDLYGGSAVRGQVADASSLPRFFEVAYDVARRTDNLALRAEIYQTMRHYLDWWLSPVKRDGNTGLISGFFEETFGEADQNLAMKPDELIRPQSVAPVDLNVAVAVGAKFTAELAFSLGRTEEANQYRQVFQELSHGINTTLWDEQDGVYYNYDLHQGRARHRLIVSTFDPLRFGIAPPLRRDRLLQRMLDPGQFNWGRLPLSSLAMTEADYVEATGRYDGRAWWGNVWTLRNAMVIKGLEESGRPDLAAELNWATIKAFHRNYTEFVVPSTGEGHGVKRYGWSASEYIAAIVEHLFGVDYDRIQKQVRITPHVPPALYGKDISLDDLILPTGGDTRLSVRINQSTAKAARISVNITGQLPEGTLQVALPGSMKEITVPAKRFLVIEFP